MAQDNVAAKWLEQAGLLKFRDIGGILSLTRFKDEIYILNSPTRWTPKPGSKLPEVVAPRGFVTDLASVPPVFFSLFRPDGVYAHAAVIHDFLYWHQTTSRDAADEVFKNAMTDLGVSSVERGVLFQAVSLLGKGSWDKNAALKRAGERRILKEFPTDPRTTWAEWKTRPRVFLDT
ncbi:MAG: DUF1353 domain-containing protein [Ramlibacter sp.]